MTVEPEFQIQVKIPFHSYGVAYQDKEAIRQIKKWVSDTVQDRLSYIPLYVEGDIEDCTYKCKAKVKIR